MDCVARRGEPGPYMGAESGRLAVIGWGVREPAADWGRLAGQSQEGSDCNQSEAPRRRRALGNLANVYMF